MGDRTFAPLAPYSDILGREAEDSWGLTEGHVLSTWSGAKQMVSLVFTHVCVPDLLGHSEEGSGTADVSAGWGEGVDDTLTHNPFLHQIPA